jgi:pyrophosphatase PpaX
MDSSINRIACVIFDMDGTLTRTNELIFESFNHVAEKYTGKRLTPQEIIALFGPPEEGGLAKVVGTEAVGKAMDELCEYYQNHHARLAALHPGIDDVLHYLKSRGVKLAIFTGKGNRTAEITLRKLNIAQYFDLVVSGSDVVNHKPHHEGITKVIERFALTPEAVLMVGDALGDVRASRAAGVKVAAVVWDSYDRESVLLANADFVFHSVDEMSEWFKSHIN